MEELQRFFANKRILVTGGAGFIGGNLVNRLIDYGSRVVIVDDFSSGNLRNVNRNAICCVGSVANKIDLERIFQKHPPDIVFHLAALFANQNSIEHPELDLKVNGMGTLHTLMFSDEYKVSKFIYTSSSCIYGSAKLPTLEDYVTTRVKTPYQATKLLGELYVNDFCFWTSLPAVIVRLFNVYGPGDMPGKYRSVIPNFLIKALTKSAIMIHGSGNQTRDFTYVDDIVDGLCLCACEDKAVGETFNLGSGRETSIKELVKLIAELTGYCFEVKFIPERMWDDVDRRCADINLARTILGYTPKWDLRAGLESTIKWFRRGGLRNG